MYSEPCISIIAIIKRIDQGKQKTLSCYDTHAQTHFHILISPRHEISSPGVVETCSICRQVNVQSNTLGAKAQFPKTSLAFYLNTNPATFPAGAQQIWCKTRLSSPVAQWHKPFKKAAADL